MCRHLQGIKCSLLCFTALQVMFLTLEQMKKVVAPKDP